MRRLVWFAALALAACGGNGSNGPDDNLPRGAYPSGPYGTTEGSLIESHAFLRPDGSMRTLEDVWTDEKNELLLLVTGSGWCVACVEEQPALQRYHGEYGPKGLYIIESLFEMADFTPATAAYAEMWSNQYSLTFDVVADPEFVLAKYYNADLTPMNMLVDVNEMKILRVSTGFDPNALEAIFEARLE